MPRRHFRPFVLGFALISMLAAPLLRAQTSKRPQAYSLTMVSSMGRTTTAKVYRNGAKERIDLTVAPGPGSPEEVHQVLLFDSQAHQTYAQDPASHACYRTQIPSEKDLSNYDPFMAVAAGGGLAKMFPGAKFVETQTINGFTAKLYDVEMEGLGTEKISWSDVYDLPIKMEIIQSNLPPSVMMEIKRLTTTAPPASLFAAPSGCTETQGKWTDAGFEVNGQSAVTLGAVAVKPQASAWTAPPSLPTQYTLLDVTSLTDASLFTGQPSTLKIYRNGSKERVELEIAPWAANRNGLRMRFLFDFIAHKAYTTAWNGNVSSCSWIKYVSADAPGAYDPITATASMMTGLFKQGTWKDLGPQALNGIPAEVEETLIEGVLPAKVWIAKKGGFIVKYSAPMPGGKGTGGFEVKQLSLAPPPASVFAPPAGCSETQGEWSDTGLNASASETVAAATPPSQPSSAASAPSASPQSATPAPANLVANGDFESGNKGFTSGYTYGNVNGPTSYTITTNPSQADGAYSDWYNGGDHTTGKGKMLVVNGANSATTPVWEEIVPVTPNTTYTFSYWGAEVDHESSSLPHLQLTINGTAVGTGDIPATSPDNGGSWMNFTFTWNSGSSSHADLALFDLNTDTGWNDFALDDISFGAHSAP
jgi:hypothetical protein